MNSRLAMHLLRRLRHRLEREAFERAVDADILITGTWDVDGVQVRGFTAHPVMLEKSPREIERLVARIGSRDGSAGSSAMPAMDFDDDTYVIAEDGIHPLNRSKGKGKQDAAPSRSRHGGDARYRKLTATLLREVRKSASRPQAAEVATLMLVARAVAESGVPLAEVLRVLRTPLPIITLTAAVPGFEGTLLDLLARGLVLPGTVALASGYELSGRTARFNNRTAERWRVIMFPGIKYDPDEPDDAQKRVGQAALMEHPILGVAETGERLPQRLQCAAQLSLATGRLDATLIRAVIATVLGEEPEGSLSDESCSLLTLSDLAIAVRPCVTPSHAIRVLGEIAATKRTDNEAGQGKPGSTASRAGSPSRKPASKSGRGDPGSGSEIIHPVPLTSGDASSLVDRVETLTGYGAASEWAMSLKSDLDLWRQGELAWEEMSTKLLISGPPGTGKTTFARALCNSLQVPLVVSSVSTWLEPGYLGDVLKRMSAAFAEAESLQPAILFIDELDGIGTRRQRGDWAEYGNGIINRGLELLDGATRSSGVIVVAATNHPTMIDPALLRSGRLETHIEIPPPDTEALAGILRHHLKGDLDGVVLSAPPPVATQSAARQSDCAIPEAAVDPAISDGAADQDKEERGAVDPDAVPGRAGTDESRPIGQSVASAQSGRDERPPESPNALDHSDPTAPDPDDPDTAAANGAPAEQPGTHDGPGCAVAQEIDQSEIRDSASHTSGGAPHGEV